MFTSDNSLNAHCMDQGACMFFILIWTIKRMDHNLVQHLRQKVLWSLHLLHRIYCLIHILGAGVLDHQCFLKKERMVRLWKNKMIKKLQYTMHELSKKWGVYCHLVQLLLGRRILFSGLCRFLLNWRRTYFQAKLWRLNKDSQMNSCSPEIPKLNQ